MTWLRGILKKKPIIVAKGTYIMCDRKAKEICSDLVLSCAQCMMEMTVIGTSWLPISFNQIPYLYISPPHWIYPFCFSYFHEDICHYPRNLIPGVCDLLAYVVNDQCLYNCLIFLQYKIQQQKFEFPKITITFILLPYVFLWTGVTKPKLLF